MTVSVNNRIAQLITAVGLNKNSFSKRLAVSSTSIGYITGERQTKPSFELLEKLATNFPQVRMEWLIRGQGDMLKPSDNADSECQDELRHLGLKYQDLEQEHERLQLSYARQNKLLIALGGPNPQGE